MRDLDDRDHDPHDHLPEGVGDKRVQSASTAFFARFPPATVVMEACGTAHYWARKLQELGHSVVLLPPPRLKRSYWADPVGMRGEVGPGSEIAGV